MRPAGGMLLWERGPSYGVTESSPKPFYRQVIPTGLAA
jgi:hypothetical protein